MQQEKDKVISDLQAEISRLKEALARQQSAVPDAGVASVQTTPAAASAAAASANESVALDAVVVRSRNRLERLQDVPLPLSVSVVPGRELDRQQANDIDAVTKRLGNIFWNQGNQRTSSLSIRGIGKQSQTEAQDPSVGVIVDGVSLGYNALTSSYYFTDIDSVEVARGSQGTLLGKNSSIGAISFTTRRPSFTPSADYSLLYGQKGRVTGTFAGIVPIIADTQAEAREFERELRALVLPQAGLTFMSASMNHDLSVYGIDTPVHDFTDRITGSKGRFMAVVAKAVQEGMTFGQLGKWYAETHAFFSPVGTPSQVADQLVTWYRDQACDGFVVLPPYMPGAANDFVTRVVPELQARGAFRTAYPGTTLRDTLGLSVPAYQRP